MSLLQKILAIVLVLFALLSSVEAQKSGKKVAAKKPEPKKACSKGKKVADDDEDEDEDDDDEEEAKPKGKKAPAPKKTDSKSAPKKAASKPAPKKGK
jgi:phosphopantothenoylcysteine synthetase/decarboxylase